MVQTDEEKRQKKREYDKNRYPLIKEQKRKYDKEYNKKNSEKINLRSRRYRLENGDKIRQWKKEYYEENKEEISKKQKEYNIKNKERIRENKKIYQEKNKEKRKLYQDIYYIKNLEKLKSKSKEYREKNKEKKKNTDKRYCKQIKEKAFDILGGRKCILCGVSNINFLTVDHIDEKGYLDRPSRIGGFPIYKKIIDKKYSEEELLNLRVLCYSCNCSRTREYMNLPQEKITTNQKYKLKLWKEAFKFFGPCKTCGEKNIKFLCISHIHNDGAERRRNGESTATHLLAKFRGLGWPESLKQDYCLECFNDNCSRKA
jgi:hypothetical protein